MKTIELKYSIYALPLLFTIAVLIWVVKASSQEEQQQLLNSINDQLSLSLRRELATEKEDTLQTALIIAEDSELKHALAMDDEERGFNLLKQKIAMVQQYSSTIIRAQIITADLTVFARSWDSENYFAGMPLDTYRHDLDQIILEKKPRSSIEVGRRLGIKSTVPIYEKNKLLGFMEVLQFFDHSTSFFQKFGIDLYVLLDEKFYNTAVLMQNNPSVAWFLVANQRYNSANLKVLQRIDMKKLMRQTVIYRDERYIFYAPMQNGSGERIGAYLFVMPQKSVELFANSGQNLSFLLAFSRNSLYNIVKKEEYENRVYHSGYDKDLLTLKDSVPDEDRELFMQEARDVLSTYSKEELIALMLHHKMAKKITGEIR